jgi:hypothetical protein
MNAKTFFTFAIATGMAISRAPAQTNTSAATAARNPSPAAARPAAPKSPSPVDSVIQLVKTGVSENIIIRSLQKSNKPVALSPADLLKLNQAGVSDNIIEAMMDPSVGLVPASAPGPEPVEAAVAPTPVPEPGAMERVAPLRALPPIPAPVEAPQSAPEAVVTPAPAPPTPPAPVRSLAQATDWRSAILNKIESLYPPTKVTADKSDIVTPGAVLVLKKDGLNMALTSFRTMMASDTYKDGKISNGFFGRLGGSSSRVFVRGEKFWLIRAEVRDDGLVLEFLSDPYNDLRYTAALRFPFTKGSPPSPDQLSDLVGQVLGVDAAPPVAASAPGAAPSSAAVARQEQAPPPIAPPPPPADQPPATARIGQTKDEVVANFGQPARIANVGTKQILYYPDFKVTLVGGKVTDIQ